MSLRLLRSCKQKTVHYKQQLLACDSFTADTLFLQTIYVFFFIEVSTRRVYFAGCTDSPTGQWVTQQARQKAWQLEDRDPTIRFLIHDRDSKFSEPFDNVFQSEGIHIIRTPVRAPNANAFAERWIRSIRNECLDKLIIVNESHLRRAVRKYVDLYNTCRPHQGIQQSFPVEPTAVARDGPIQRREVLGGIIHDYQRRAA